MEFNDPLKVSQGDSADKLFCMFFLSQFLGKDGSKLPEMMVKSVMVPPQVTSLDVAEQINSIGTAMTAAALTSGSASVSLSFLTAAPLNFLWGMINAQ